MRTRTFCPSCGGYRDIEDGHRVCTFCEYLDEQRGDAKEILSDKLAPRTFSVDGVTFTVSFGVELEHVVASLGVSDPRYNFLAYCLTTTWKLEPLKLLESLCDHRAVQVGEFYRITYGDDPDHGEGNPLDVNILDDADELDVPSAFFSEVVIQMAKLHLQVVGPIHFPWFPELSAAAKTKIS